MFKRRRGGLTVILYSAAASAVQSFPPTQRMDMGDCGGERNLTGNAENAELSLKDYGWITVILYFAFRALRFNLPAVASMPSGYQTSLNDLTH